MKHESFPMCCTATIIYDFGQTRLSAGRTAPRSEDSIRSFIQERMGGYATGSGRLFVAITNSDQKTAAKVLRELGFSHSKWMSKIQHSRTKMRLWWKQA